MFYYPFSLSSCHMWKISSFWVIKNGDLLHQQTLNVLVWATSADSSTVYCWNICRPWPSHRWFQVTGAPSLGSTFRTSNVTYHWITSKYVSISAGSKFKSFFLSGSIRPLNYLFQVSILYTICLKIWGRNIVSIHMKQSFLHFKQWLYLEADTWKWCCCIYW